MGTEVTESNKQVHSTEVCGLRLSGSLGFRFRESRGRSWSTTMV